jgi:hypothetical protein
MNQIRSSINHDNALCVPKEHCHDLSLHLFNLWNDWFYSRWIEALGPSELWLFANPSHDLGREIPKLMAIPLADARLSHTAWMYALWLVFHVLEHPRNFLFQTFWTVWINNRQILATNTVLDKQIEAVRKISVAFLLRLIKTL